MTFGARRGELKHHIRGDGVEVGALHSPFDITGLSVTRIRYVDRFDVPELRRHYPELEGHELVPVDIIDDGQVLSKVPDGSLDFVIANHMIEHCDNPLGTLRNWVAKLKPGGICFVALPDQRKGWDERREVTTLQHMIEDERVDPAERKRRNREHFREWVELVGNEKDEAKIQHLIDIDYSIHYHVFTFESFRRLLQYARDEMRVPFEIIDSMEPSEASWESIFVLKRTSAQDACAVAPTLA
jgi:SAM-dependent methyltransferase